MDRQLKHLEFIQKNIERFSKNSFIIKGWMITLTVAGIGLSKVLYDTLYSGLVLFSILICWILDSYYLKQERLFRKLYEKHSVVKSISRDSSYDLSLLAEPVRHEVKSILLAMISFPLWLFYLALIVVVMIGLYRIFLYI